jgi:branched-chain amino acid transport system permease protein
MHAFMRTPVGRLANAVRDNPERVEFIGYNPQRVRFIVFCVAATFAGLAGGLHAINYEIVAAEALSATRSGAVLLMVYIGGVHHFMGAILGAVAITWLQVSLSDYTTAWLLYLGLLFMGVVAFVPGGLAGLVALHVAAWHARALPAIARAYLVVLPFAFLASLGLVTLIEIVYRRSTQPEAGALMRLFWIPMDTARPWPWLAAASVVALGLYASMKAWPRVQGAWAAAGEAAHARA